MSESAPPAPPKQSQLEYDNTLPVVPLRDVVVFPRVVLSLYVGRQMSLDALNKAVEDGGHVFLATQKAADVEEPTCQDLYDVGCVANVLQILRLPDGTVKVLVEGISRGKASYVEQSDDTIAANITTLVASNPPSEEESMALRRTFHNQMSAYARINSKISDDILSKMKETDDLERLIDYTISFFPLDIKKRQRMLEMIDITRRANELLATINKEIEVQKIEKKIRGRVKNQMEKNHREYYLQEQARAIQKELGDEQSAEADSIKKRIDESGMSKQAHEKCEQELRKLKLMSPMSAEASVIRTYLDTVLSIPWKKSSPPLNSYDKARKILDADHYGLDEIKDRILEYLAVQRRVPNSKAPILCFVGPPGVGKTSLGASIATSTGRVFGRIALGGVRDEAEIRGHRRTYVGAMPGKIISAMTRAGVKNPVILLDEIDKMGYDFRGDPSSALLEVLDPEQNSRFSDHYVELDYDLSKVMFVTTANTLDIPPALMDRLEIVRLSGYTERERMNIATRHLIPRQFKETGLSKKEATFTENGLRDIIRYYTSEAGVRTLERNISKICRRVVLENDRKELIKQGQTDKSEDQVQEKSIKTKRVTSSSLEKYLGVRKYRYGMSASENKIGQVTGLVWTSVGGDLLSIEMCKFSGRGKVLRTGKLGQVLQESVDAAFSSVRSRCDDYQVKVSVWRESDFHIHLPEGAISKDGPSAGIAIATAILSVVTGIPVRADVAMTGEITLRGEILPIGGVKEKLLAAARGGIKRVILPAENEKDLIEISQEIKNKFEICLVKQIDDVFKLALVKMPLSNPTSRKRTITTKMRKESRQSSLITH